MEFLKKNLAGGPEHKNALLFFCFSLPLNFYRVSQRNCKIILAGGPEQKTRSYFSAFPYFKISIGSLREFLEFF